MGDHPVKLIAMGDEKAAPVKRLKNCVPGDDDATKMHAAEIAHPVVMVTRHIDDTHPFARHAQDLLHHIIMGLRPIPTAFQFPTINNVANQIKGLTVEDADKVEQQLRLTAARAQMDVGNKGRPYSEGPPALGGLAWLKTNFLAVSHLPHPQHPAPPALGHFPTKWRPVRRRKCPIYIEL